MGAIWNTWQPFRKYEFPTKPLAAVKKAKHEPPWALPQKNGSLEA